MEKLRLKKLELSEKEAAFADYRKAIKDFEESQAKLKGLDERQYAFLKSMRKPPVSFHHIIAGVLLAIGYENCTWDKCRKFLINFHSRREILEFVPNKILPKSITNLDNWRDQYPESFTKERAERVSKVALLLLNWLMCLWKVIDQLT
eukprot:UN06823